MFNLTKIWYNTNFPTVSKLDKTTTKYMADGGHLKFWYLYQSGYKNDVWNVLSMAHLVGKWYYPGFYTHSSLN